MNIKGFRTIIIGLIGVIGVPALTYISSIDWTALGVSPVTSAVITSVVFMIMRVFTTTSIFKPTAVPAVAAMSDEDLNRAGIAKILTEPTLAGKELAALNPGNVVSVVANPSLHTGVGRWA